MAKKEPLLDNLRYIFCKDGTNGKKAGFDVQLMRDRLTEIRYDIDHMQADIDDLKGKPKGHNSSLPELEDFKKQVSSDLKRIDAEMTTLNSRLSAIEQLLHNSN